MAGKDLKMVAGHPERLLKAKELDVLTREGLEAAAKNILGLILRVD